MAESWSVPGEAVARKALADALEAGHPIGAGVESAQAMRAALRDVWALAASWQKRDAGYQLAAAEIEASIRGEPR